MTTNSDITPPKADKIPYTLSAHGSERVDPYYWMKLSEEEKESPDDEHTKKVVAYLKEENAYLEAKLKHTEGLQDKLYHEIIGRIKQTDESVPYFNNKYWYYTRFVEGQEYPIYCRKKGSMNDTEEILLDVNELAKGYEFYDEGDLSVSEDNKLLAYSEDTVSRRRYTIYVKDLTTGKLIGEPIPNTEGEITWANDSKTFFYVRKDSVTLRSRWIMRHTLGTDPSTDQIVAEEKDETFYTGVYKTKSKKFLVIWAGSTLTNHYQILEADNPMGEFHEFSPRERGLEYSIDHRDSVFYIITNLDAVNFRLMETPDNQTTRDHWREKIPHRADTLLQGIEVFHDYIVLSERSRANTMMQIIDLRTDERHYLDFGEPAYTVYGSVNHEMDTPIFRYGYTSLTTPNSTYDYDMKTRKRTLLKQQEVVGGYRPTDYETERLWATAEDGTQIPMSIVYKKGIRKDGENFLMLYGYGAYGASMSPAFSSVRLSLLDRGFIYAIAHIRGGQEMGRQWYDDGKMFRKKNTFTDFISCAEFLIESKYTKQEKLFASGGSAGGMLMGAVANLRPDLFKGILADVPFVDVVTTMLDESIPLTTGEFDEWGDPKNPESYQYMLEYSPYDQVKPQNYPNMLVTTGLHDSQVQYWEPAKWVARLREVKTDDNILLLRTNLETGHGGASGRFKVHRETAQEYAFILDLAGINS